MVWCCVCISETHAEPSLQATQMKLKRARLADDLNEKLAQRPGPMELVEKNILPVDVGKKLLNIVFSCLIKLTGIAQESKCQLLNRFVLCGFFCFVLVCILFDTAAGGLDVYNFNEDSSEALSPEQPASHESQGSASSPVEARLPEPSSVSPPTGSKLQVSVLMVPRFTSRLITSSENIQF